MNKVWVQVFLFFSTMCLVACTPPGAGSITVSSDPTGLEVILDDSLTGQLTDCVLEDIKLGYHNLRLECPGYLPWSRDVELTADDPDYSIHAVLFKTPGAIAVNSDPQGAAIWLDGVNAFSTTYHFFDSVAIGQHVVTLKLSGYFDWVDTVVTYGADTAVVDAELIPASEILISPDSYMWAGAGETAVFPLEVRNFSNQDDVADISFVSNQPGWSHALVDIVGNNLSDTDGDGEPDVGPVPGNGGSVKLSLRVLIPYPVLPGLYDTTIVYARSSLNESVYDSAVVVTRVHGRVLVDIEPDTAIWVSHGEDAVFWLRITNLGSLTDTIEIGSYASPDFGWDYKFFYISGDELSDTDHDGVPDVGALDSAQTATVGLAVSPPVYLDTEMEEQRYVWIRTCFTNSEGYADDSVRVTTIFKP